MMRALKFAFVTVLGMAWAGTSPAEEALGRLFFTPAQRAALDAGKKLATPKTGIPAPVAVRRPLDLRGVVIRSDGQRTVWVNGRAYQDQSPEGVDIRTNPAAPGNTEVRVPGQALAARVKVGQQIDLNSGAVRDIAPRNPHGEENAAAPSTGGAPRALRAKNKASGTQVQGAGEQGGEGPAAASR
jgi:hypothetical protein